MKTLIELLREYRLPDIGVRFIDREKEILNILALKDFQMHIILGPRGCGKTKLLHALSYLLFRAKENTQVTYIGYLRKGLNLYTQIYSTNTGILRDIAKWTKKYFKVVSKFKHPANGLELLGFIDPCAPLKIATKKKFIFKKRLKSKHLIIIDGLDEVIGDQDIIKTINRFCREFQGKLLESIRKEGGSIKILAVFSRNITGLPKLSTSILWNFNKNIYRKFLSEISCPLEFDKIWALCGGNLGLTIELLNSKWNTNSIIEQRLTSMKRTIEDYASDKKKILTEVLNEIKKIEEIDDLAEKDLWKYFEQKYFTMSIPEEGEKLSEIPKESWIGRKAAWQAPIYMYCFKAVLRKGFEASAEDVVKLFK